MLCASCGFENPEGTRFCEECGTKLVRACPSCGREVRPTAKFCGECGMPLAQQSRVQSSESGVRSSQPLTPSPQPPISYTPKHLAERIRAEQAAMEARGITAGERKTITALFADMAGFTALTRDLDPEDARRIIDPTLKLMMDAVHRYEGYVAQSLGDGIFALFGAPIAHEDHPQRALYAALRMQEEMRRYSDKIRLEKGVPLQIRVGINTGEVVLRSIRKDDLHTDYVPVGHSTNERKRREKVMGKVLALDRSLEDTLPYLLFLLGIAEATSSLQQMDPQVRRRRTFEAIKRLLVRESLNQPLLLIFEDLHWLDNETQAFLMLLSESVATARILLLVNYRLEYRHEWGNKTYYTQLRLDPLGQEEAGELLHEAELYRLKGQLTLQSRQVEDKSQTSHGQAEGRSEVPNTQHPTPSPHAEAEAEACFHKAIEIARRQQAKSLELRAVMSLSRLWQQLGKKEEARQMLAEIYGWFTEGLDTADLREAKALLEKLAQYQ